MAVYCRALKRLRRTSTKWLAKRTGWQLNELPSNAYAAEEGEKATATLLGWVSLA
jgi:hypothetical protein